MITKRIVTDPRATTTPTIRLLPPRERERLPVRWADVWPVLALILLFCSLYIAFYVSIAGWGFAVVVLSFALWPKEGEDTTTERRYKLGPFTFRGDREFDKWMEKKR